MDLLGGYNSDSDSDSDENNAAGSPQAAVTTSTAVATERSSRAILGSQDKKLPTPITSSATSKADKKKRVIGKKLLKLSSVLPEHILNQLQLGGGGGTKEKSYGNDDDDSSDSSDEEKNDDQETPLARRKTTTSNTSSSRNFSKDEGIMGLLSELSKSTSSSSRPQSSTTKILGSNEDDSTAVKSAAPLTQKSQVTKSEPLGAAFLTTTVQTTKRKRTDPTAVRSIHENDRKDSTSSTGHTQLPGATSAHTSNQESTVLRPSISAAVPQPRLKSNSSLRSAAPPVGVSPRMHSSHTHSTYAPVVSQGSNNSYEQMYHSKQQQGDGNSSSVGGKAHAKKKKPLSRKRQMEQMLRAGKLDEVQGDHEFSGVAHVYNYEGDSAASMVTSSSRGVGVRNVPTSSYDTSTGRTATSTDVTSRQKNTNQLNSLLANAASLESHRAQNPLFHMSKGKSGSHRANAKQKYGW